MSYYDVEPQTDECRIGKRIYMEALAHRKGFRDDHMRIEDPEIWTEIFEAIGRAAKESAGE